MLLLACSSSEPTRQSRAAGTSETDGSGQTASTVAEPVTLGGILQLQDTDEPWGNGIRCNGRGGYEDIEVGTQVVVRDQSDDIVAVGELGESVAERPNTCLFPIRVDGVSANRPFCTTEISHRGAVGYQPDTLEAAGWRMVTLSS